jgi:hypothetical protein
MFLHSKIKKMPVLQKRMLRALRLLMGKDLLARPFQIHFDLSDQLLGRAKGTLGAQKA